MSALEQPSCAALPAAPQSDDDIEILMTGTGQSFTQSETDLQTPQTTVTSISSVQARSVPHILSVRFADDEQTPTTMLVANGGDKFVVSAVSVPNGLKKHSTVANGTLTANGHTLPKLASNGDLGGGVLGGSGLKPFLNGSINSSTNPLVADSERAHHELVRKNHAQTRVRHFTDPVDFDGILKIIGGCGRWQLYIYFLISLQKIPHAMFNLSIIFMMFKPDHWCYVSDFDNTAPDAHAIPPWSVEQAKNISIPYVESDGKTVFDSCNMYNRGEPGWSHSGNGVDETLYHKLAHWGFENASAYLESTNETVVAETLKCKKWSFDRSVMNDTIVTQWNLVCDENLRRADAHLAYSLGYFLGCIVSGLSSDRFGRKPTVIGFGILASLFGLILPYSQHFSIFLLVRFLGAVCNEAADLAGYVLCMEITGKKHRAVVGSLLWAPWALGYCLLVAIAYATKSWRTVQMIAAVAHTVSALLICPLPESPRWLIANSRFREAESIIRRACRMNKCSLPPDLELIKHVERRKYVARNQRATLLAILKSPTLIVITLILYIVWIVTALVYYGVALNLSDQSATHNQLFGGSFFINNAIAAAIEFPVLLVCAFTLRYGRKKCQATTLVLSGVMLLCVCVTPRDISWLRLTFFFLGKACIQGAFNILYIFTLEVYPTQMRNSAVGVCSMIARIGSSVASYVAIVNDASMPDAPLIIFGVSSVFAGVLVLRLKLPETAGEDMPETIDDALKLKTKCSYSCAPPKHSQCEDKDFLSDANAFVNMKVPLPEAFTDDK